MRQFTKRLFSPSSEVKEAYEMKSQEFAIVPSTSVAVAAADAIVAAAGNGKKKGGQALSEAEKQAQTRAQKTAEMLQSIQNMF